MQRADDSIQRRKVEAWLDRGHGDCWLRCPDVAETLEAILRDGDGHRYRLHAWVIMPNHVHAVVHVFDVPLSGLLGRWKGASARAGNGLLDRRGRFWQPDYFETLIRDSEHLRRAVRYTENNPTKPGLVKDPAAWRWSSARWRDSYGRLAWQRDVSG